MSNPKPKDLQDFSSLKKKVLKEISLEIIKSDLQKSISELHQHTMADVANSISTIEAHCTKEIKERIEKQIQTQLNKHLEKVVQAYQADIEKFLSPLMKQAEKNVNQLPPFIKQRNFIKRLKINML